MNNASADYSSPNPIGRVVAFLGISLLLAGCGGGGGGSADDSTSGPAQGEDNLTLAQLGQRIFEDTNLSNPVGQSCASCHVASAGFADPRSSTPATGVSVGADGTSVGSRNAPTASYAGFIPPFTEMPPASGNFRGGQFIDGRASTLELQARAPFLNPLEMSNASEAAVIAKLRVADYAPSFLNLFGADAFDNVTLAYSQMVTAIAAFERTDVFSPFSSRFDAVMAGDEAFTTAEENGQALFSGKAECSRCHSTGGDRVFSDFRYSNIGVPANPDNPFLDVPGNAGFVDLGLGAALDPADSDQDGKFRTPTLRNVALTAPYMHNGVFTTLTEVVEFYNVRDVAPAVIPEVSANVDNLGNIGELNLTPTEIAELVAFMQTLSDR